MTRTVWKAALKSAGVQELDIPSGSELLCAREQFGEVCVWFRCDPTAAIEKRKIAVIGTGHPASSDGRYLGTAFLLGGTLVLHVFEHPAEQLK